MNEPIEDAFLLVAALVEKTSFIVDFQPGHLRLTHEGDSSWWVMVSISSYKVWPLDARFLVFTPRVETYSGTFATVRMDDDDIVEGIELALKKMVRAYDTSILHQPGVLPPPANRQ